MVAVVASIPKENWGQDPTDTLPWEWNADIVEAYWARRPVAVARRTVAVTYAGLSVGLALLIDRARGKAACSCRDQVILHDHVGLLDFCHLCIVQSAGVISW